MRLNKNLMSMDIYRNYTKSLGAQSKVLNHISTGNQVNKAKDNPINLGKSENLRMQIRGLSMAQRNLQDGTSMMQTFDGALDSVSSSLVRMKELMVQGTNDTLNNDDRKNIQMEIDQLKEHINSVARDSEFNGNKLIGDESVDHNGYPNYIRTVVGANVGETAKIPTFNVNTKVIGIEGTAYVDDIDITSTDPAKKDISIVDSAIVRVNSIRSQYGAIQNKFESLAQSLGSITDSAEKADSNLRDADMANEMMEYSKEGLLINSALALMTQTNNMPQNVLRILDKIK
ncbi:flagellin [Clostridium paridis]|uniref:Flagellin n=1 Tax=Clostridium paridis TaxID=2803863 RepID=A0A937K4Q7_9CLOT|nr:flagellin [Clostridium paridis]MBL4932922.1 flagellin [Clostridium paridis]